MVGQGGDSSNSCHFQASPAQCASRCLGAAEQALWTAGTWCAGQTPAVTTRSCSAPTVRTAPKRRSPSEVVVADGAIERSANTDTASQGNCCRSKRTNGGWLPGVVRAAALTVTPSHCSSLPYPFMNSVSKCPDRNRTRFIVIRHSFWRCSLLHPPWLNAWAC